MFRRRPPVFKKLMTVRTTSRMVMTACWPNPQQAMYSQPFITVHGDSQWRSPGGGVRAGGFTYQNLPKFGDPPNENSGNAYIESCSFIYKR